VVDGSRVVVDLTETTFIDSSTIGALIGCRRNGRHVTPAVAFVAPPGTEPRRVLDLIEAGDQVRIFPVRELALVALTQRPIKFLASPPYAGAG